jgi:hypothetical protein
MTQLTYPEIWSSDYYNGDNVLLTIVLDTYRQVFLQTPNIKGVNILVASTPTEIDDLIEVLLSAKKEMKKK